MSIQSEIDRISQNVSDSLDAVEAKGVTIPAGSNSDNLATLIAQIDTDEIYWAVSGTTTSSELETAYQANKLILLVSSGILYSMSERDSSTKHIFVSSSGTSGSPTLSYIVCENDVWSSASDVGLLPSTTSIPSKTSDLTNDSGFITGMTILSYGSSTWAEFLAAYTANKIVYCRASSQSNPASGSQTRMAFLAYVNNQTSPTEAEFQYYRSVSTHTASQQGDQVYVYKINSSDTWSVTTREAYTKIAAGTGLSSSYSSGILTLSSTLEAATETPSDLGTAAVGTSTKYAKEDHVHNYPDIVHVGSSAPADTNIELWLDSSSGGNSVVSSVDGKTGTVTVLPSGGTTGQVLKKVSSTSYDVTWANESGSVTSVDGKTGVVNVLPVGGAAGKVLKKKTSTDYDVEWSDDSGGVTSVNGMTGDVTVSTIAVQDNAPSGGELVWIDTDEPGESITIPQIDDNSVSAADTWSSQKIASSTVTPPTFSSSSTVFSQSGTYSGTYTIPKTGWYLFQMVGYWGSTSVTIAGVTVAVAQYRASSAAIYVTNTLYLQQGTVLTVNIDNSSGSIGIIDIS